MTDKETTKTERRTETKKPVELIESDLERACGGITQGNLAEPDKRPNADDKAHPFVVDGPFT